MRLLVLTYVAAGVLELLGIWLSLEDLRRLQRRLRDFAGRPIQVFSTDAAAASEAAAVGIVLGGDPTLEQRIDALETWRKAMTVGLADRDAAIRRELRAEISSEVSSLRASVNDRFTGLNEVIGAPDRWWWRGPVLLAVGVVVGAVGNLLAPLATA